ncbi:ABC transporter substrate-binding protein [Rudaeicoccus suwonensis]|uniref:Amino acid ABC transporter substrate-binding protein (PAAT family) n=1 Tax=Rudaeicoccus suwonensis TaxID=657409 RepID=A0A561E3V0_9MICO|nr:ABC transporter substrate-binding protein [Rudaeicoccus suwonensis]TWE10261.1 amino acid ABC transporter substrate-binding protein (PAAT family) [Rudaeicoccus suwonensis]
MKKRIIPVLAAGIAVAVTGCSSSGSSGTGTGASNKSSGASNVAVGTVGNIAAGVAADPAAVALLPASAKANGTISVAMDLQYPPTSFLSTSNQPEGFNVDISRLIAAKLGLKLQIDNVAFDTIVPGLTGGRYDFTATDMSATAARLQVLDMINYWSDGSSLATRSGNPENLSINNSTICGKTIAVMTGTTQQETYLPILSKQCTTEGKPAVKQVVLPDVNGALTQLASGRVDGIFYDTPSLAYAVQQHGAAFELAGAQYAKPAALGNDLVAIGLAKNSPLTKAVQSAMQSIMDSPLYLKALSDWGMGAGAIKTASIATAAAG